MLAYELPSAPLKISLPENEGFSLKSLFCHNYAFTKAWLIHIHK